MTNFKQIQAFIAVSEECSFSKAAERENATQSGMSQHIRALERALGTPLFDRRRDGVTLNEAGKLYYQHCVRAMQSLAAGETAIQGLGGEVAGVLRAGLMPAFTRAALAPALQRFVARYPRVNVQITEAYSGALANQVRRDELDFAVVPAGPAVSGVRTTLLSRDTEMLVSSVHSGRKPLEPVVLNELAPLKLVVPGPSNVRRDNLQRYLTTNAVQVDAMIEMDAMLGTLEFVAQSDWVTILPGLILIADHAGADRIINPLSRPRMDAEFVLIEPARRTLSRPAALFLDELRAEITAIGERWHYAGE